MVVNSGPGKIPELRIEIVIEEDVVTRYVAMQHVFRMDKPNGIEDLFHPTKLQSKWSLFLLPSEVLPNRCLACKLQDDGVFHGAKISNDAAVIMTKTLINELFPFQEVRSRRVAEFDDSVKTCDHGSDTHANQIPGP
jgi:hypothetical protein